MRIVHSQNGYSATDDAWTWKSGSEPQLREFERSRASVLTLKNWLFSMLWQLYFCAPVLSQDYGWPNQNRISLASEVATLIKHQSPVFGLCFQKYPVSSNESYNENTMASTDPFLCTQQWQASSFSSSSLRSQELSVVTWSPPCRCGSRRSKCRLACPLAPWMPSFMLIRSSSTAPLVKVTYQLENRL